LVAEYEKWVRKPFPSNLTDAFEFVGMSVPVAADDLRRAKQIGWAFEAPAA
jgi:hypothetical protein